jgi:hypothetical protein
MTGYKRGDVVLVRFVFSDETGERQRPAVIVSSDAYHKGRQEAIIAAITSRTDRILVGDHLISDWQEARAAFPLRCHRNHKNDKAGYDSQEAWNNAPARYERN